MERGFELDPRLAADTRPLASLGLCELRLLDEARYPWLVLVPRRPAVSEILDLSAPDQASLWQEAGRIAGVLKQLWPQGKLNLGSLGNVVAQLHLHVLIRHPGDPAWPGPVWGHSPRQPYTEAAAAALTARLRAALPEVAQ